MNSTATATPQRPDYIYQAAQPATQFAAQHLFPTFPTREQSGAIYTLDPDQMNEVPPMQDRGPSASVPRTRTKLSDTRYLCKEYSLEEPVPEAEARSYGSQEAALGAAEDRATAILRVWTEQRAHALATSAAVPSANAGSPWFSFSEPYIGSMIGDVQQARTKIFQATGMEANTMVLPRMVYDFFNTDIFFKFYMENWGGGLFSVPRLQLIANLFDVEKVVVPRGTVKSEAEGEDIVSLGQIWSDSVILAHVSPQASVDMKAVSFGRQYSWFFEEELAAGEGETRVLRKDRIRQMEANGKWQTMEVPTTNRRQDAFEYKHYYSQATTSHVVGVTHRPHEVLTSPACGYHIKSVLGL